MFMFISGDPKFRSYFGERHRKGPADGAIGREKNALEWAVKSCNENMLRNPCEVYVFLKEKFQVDYDEEECPHFIQKFFYVSKETINRELEVIGETFKGSSKFHSVRSTGHRHTVEARNVIYLCNRYLSRESIPCVNAQYASQFQSYSLEMGKAFKNPVQNSHWPTGIVPQKDILEKEVTDTTNTEPVDWTLPVHTDTCINWDDLCNIFLKQHTFASLYELIVFKKLTDLLLLNEAPLVHNIRFDLNLVALSELPDNVVQQMLPIMTTSDGNCCPWSISISLFGNKSRHKEIRLRIVIEDLLDKDRYLNEECMTIGAKHQKKQPLPLVYATYSGSYGCKTLSKQDENQKAPEKHHQELHKKFMKRSHINYGFLGSGWVCGSFIRKPISWKTYKCSISQQRYINILKHIQQSCLSLEGGIAKQNALNIMWTTVVKGVKLSILSHYCL